MNKILIVLLAALYSQGVLAETHLIKEFLADPVEVVDEQGKVQREMAARYARRRCPARLSALPIPRSATAPAAINKGVPR